MTYTPVEFDKRTIQKDLVRCKSCKEELPRTAFYGDPSKPRNGNNSRCRACERERGRNRKRSTKNPAVNVAKNSKRRGVPFRKGVPEFMRTYFKKCMACGSTEDLAIDHVMPVALGGTSALKNLQMLCRSCNAAKGATYADYRYPGMVLK